MRLFLTLAVLLAVLLLIHPSAEAQLPIINFGEGGFGGAGGGCGAAPDGSFDLSKCSNSYYVAIIL